jgi:hypothetical protein
MNWLPSGKGFRSLPLNQDVTMILTGGHRPRTARASLIPSIDPGMLLSVNTILTSSRLSKILMASCAFDAQSGSNPASLDHLASKVRACFAQRGSGAGSNHRPHCQSTRTCVDRFVQRPTNDRRI